MPTAARLVGGIFLALSAIISMWVTTKVYHDLERDFIPLAATAGIVGFLFGWGSLGNRVADKEFSLTSVALRVGFSTYFWILMVFAIKLMIDGMMVHAYYQPLTAVLQIPLRMIDFLRLSLDVMIIPTILVTVLFATVMARRAHLRWDISITSF